MKKSLLVCALIVLISLTGIVLQPDVFAETAKQDTAVPKQDTAVPKGMSPEIAWQVLNRASSEYKGTRNDHVQIQQALLVFQELIKSDVVIAKPKPKQ